MSQLNDEDYPRTPSGDALTPEYWIKISGAVNQCGDRLLDLWTKYKHYHNTNLTSIIRCHEDIKLLLYKYGPIPFGVNIAVFYDNISNEEDAFSKTISFWHDSMPEDIMVTVERLRYINTKFIEKQKTIANELRGSRLTFPK